MRRECLRIKALRPPFTPHKREKTMDHGDLSFSVGQEKPFFFKRMQE